MRERWESLKVAFWELVSPPRTEEEPDPTLVADTAQRSAWVQSLRHPDGG